MWGMNNDRLHHWHCTLCCSQGLKLNADKSDLADLLSIRQQLVMISQAEKRHSPSEGHTAGVDVRLLVTCGPTDDTDVHAHTCSKACFFHLHCSRQIRDSLMIGDCGYWSTHLLCHFWDTITDCLRTAVWRLMLSMAAANHMVCSEPALSHTLVTLGYRLPDA